MNVCPHHPEIELPDKLTCPLCAQEARRAAYAGQQTKTRRTAVTRLSSDEIDALAQRISELGEGLALDQMLAALGITVVQVLLQYPPEERAPATLSWQAVLIQQIMNDYKRAKAN